MPADTPEVALARAVHLGQLGHVIPVGYAGYPYAAYPYAAGYPHGLVAHANGAVVPVDEPAVYAAKVAHAAAGGAIHPVGVYGLAYAGLVAHPNGAVVPLEPADVVTAHAALLIVNITSNVQYFATICSNFKKNQNIVVNKSMAPKHIPVLWFECV